MMEITIGKKRYKLKTCLGVAVALEKKFKLPLAQIAQKVDKADIMELLAIIEAAADAECRENIEAEAMEYWDYSDVQVVTNELLLRLMFSGTPEEVERKLSKHPGTDSQKNEIREALGLPIPNTLTQNNLSEPVTE